jgi:glyceraldehyde-3-phosphate dehydrogenase/erythrose-4-phosphate dehydrogenase
MPTASQAIVDAPSKELRMGRAGANNIVPTSMELLCYNKGA